MKTFRQIAVFPLEVLLMGIVALAIAASRLIGKQQKGGCFGVSGN